MFKKWCCSRESKFCAATLTVTVKQSRAQCAHTSAFTYRRYPLYTLLYRLSFAGQVKILLLKSLIVMSK